MSKSRQRAAEPTPPPLPAGRRRLFVGVTLALPWLVLAIIELALRLGGYGASYPLFIAYPPQPEYLLPNQDVAKRYFSQGTIVPLPQLDFFAAEKTPATYRIIFQGESSAAGFPYRHGGAPSRMLEQRLQATFPDRSIEVINTALTGINSYSLLDQSDEIIAQHPDAVLIYTGHNEYYGVFGVGSSGSLGRLRPMIRAYLALRHLRLAQLIQHMLGAVFAIPGASSGNENDAPRTVMELMAGDRHIPLGSPTYRLGLDQFRANLAELLSRYRHAKIPVLIGTLASNEREQPPFVTGLDARTDSTQWRAYLRAGTAALALGNVDSAERALDMAIRLDSTGADAFYALGKVFDARGDTVRARSAYRNAKELDQLRFRAPEAMNAIIREEAARHGATVVETQQALERASPGGVIGKGVMLEHLHPNLDGYFIIAGAFYETMQQLGMVGGPGATVAAAQARRDI
ncbi:MAG: SGNH/GDSL hydrolase family protein, partial [Gemmatimonadota bacterium]|nr:SGNH/GDSL hydrolase family protein [Gemmatimonadota bacterium]